MKLKREATATEKNYLKRCTNHSINTHTLISLYWTSIHFLRWTTKTQLDNKSFWKERTSFRAHQKNIFKCAGAINLNGKRNKMFIFFEIWLVVRMYCKQIACVFKMAKNEISQQKKKKKRTYTQNRLFCMTKIHFS